MNPSITMNPESLPEEAPRVLRSLELSIEKLTGKTAAELRQLSIEEYRTERESVSGTPLVFTSKFPFIGRGNVLRDKIVTSKNVEKQLDVALR